MRGGKMQGLHVSGRAGGSVEGKGGVYVSVECDAQDGA